MARRQRKITYKRRSAVSRFGNSIAKNIAKGAGVVSKTIPKFVKGSKYIPFVGAAMNSQYSAYKNYLKARRVISPSSLKEQTDMVGGQLSITKRKIRVGKKYNSIQKLKRVVNANKQKIVFRFNGVNRYSLGQGYYWLDNNTTSVSTRNLPFNAFDLTSVINQAGATSLAASPLTAMYIVPSTGAVDFVNRLGLQEDGSTTNANWRTETASTNNSLSLPLTKDILKWVNIRLNLYGARNKATRFTIQLVRFKDGELVPTPSGASDYLPACAVSNKRTMFYQSLMKPYTFSPVATTQNLYKKYLQVIKSESFIINDTSTSSTDTAPMSKMLNWFIRLDRLCDYTQNATNIGTGADLLDQNDYSQNAGTQVYPYVAPQQRIYLIIMASAWTDASGTPATTITPSYDLVVRLCHENFN